MGLGFDFDRADVGVLDYLEAALSEYDCSTPVNEMWERFQHLVEHCIQRFVRFKCVHKRKNNAWVTREIIQLKIVIKCRCC